MPQRRGWSLYIPSVTTGITAAVSRLYGQLRYWRIQDARRVCKLLKNKNHVPQTVRVEIQQYRWEPISAFKIYDA